MHDSYIDKLAWIHIREGRILSVREKGNTVWYMPGGTREEGETDIVALTREIKEELGVDLVEDTIAYYETFQAQAHGKPEGTFVRMTCYTAEYEGELHPCSEIEEIDFLSARQKKLHSVTGQMIIDNLEKRHLLN